jgi:HSP90 family molecular chaperone
MIITEILCKQSGIAERVSDKTEEIIILEKFVDKIRFNYSNSFQKKKFVSKRKNLRFQKKTPHSFPRKTFQEKRLICFLEPLARVYSTETRK